MNKKNTVKGNTKKQILFGDIHNHCGISYGYGSLENALKVAANHLDFVAVTGHAMWPDMYDRNPETQFVVDFHLAGFKKLHDNWQEIRALVQEANSKGLVTFQAYEMHSSTYGDHHLVSPDDSLPLLYRDSPKELVVDCDCKALTVAHHIGYPPGYRGIDWDKYDEKITPLIEVCSKHGCSMNETAPYPYYHNMGPRDSRNTVQRGLDRGYRFGFVGSTDHHAGFPGSYGDGKMAVVCSEKSRECIFDAMLNRHTYAVTGDRILCDFTVNSELFGSIIPCAGVKAVVLYDVICSYNLDKLVLYKNYKPVHIVEGLLLQPKSTDTKFKFRVEMGWGNNQDTPFSWHGKVSLEKGKFISVEPCFRGVSVLAPSAVDTDGFDSVNDLDDKILEQTEEEISWQCYTVRNVSPQHALTNAVVFELQGDMDTKVCITINGFEKTMTIEALMKCGYSNEMQYFHSQAFKVHPIITESQYHITGDWTDSVIPEPEDYYHMEVFSLNGSCAFVTPVYFK